MAYEALALYGVVSAEDGAHGLAVGRSHAPGLPGTKMTGLLFLALLAPLVLAAGLVCRRAGEAPAAVVAWGPSPWPSAPW